MLLPRLAALLPLLAAVQAFKNTAPFLMLSSLDLSGLMPPTEVSKHDKIEAALARAYTPQSCKDGRHVLISQPGLMQQDIQSMPKLVSIATSSKLPGKFQVPHVLDSIDAGLVQKDMVAACGPATVIDGGSWFGKSSSKDVKFSVYKGESLPEDVTSRSQALQKLDTTLEGILKHFPSSGPYTIVIVSTPRYDAAEDVPQYAMEDTFEEEFHQDLKRDLWTRKSNSSSKVTQDGLPLFERYQYLSPALFMGLSVSILLLLILYVALTAISGLEVSYKAFDKEMAPKNQQKQQ